MYNQIYSIVDEFMQAAEADERLSALLRNWNGRRGPKRRLSLKQVVALNLLRFMVHVKDLKAFHRLARALRLVRDIPNYENFLKASNKAWPAIAMFMQFLLFRNRLRNASGVHFVDSTPVSTCLNRRISSHKVTRAFASRGKTTKGWFYGFKLHGVCSENGMLEAVAFTGGSVSDGKALERVTRNLKGDFFCDAGYLKRAEDLARLAESGRFVHAATRRNMGRLMSRWQWERLRMRNIIESDWGVLKQNYFLEYHQARSMAGLFRHYVCWISAYILHCRLSSRPSIKTRI